MATRKSRGSDLDEGIAKLYAGPLGEFTAARNNLAKQLQKEGRRDEADEVKSLPKPSISAWAVNRLFQEERERMGELISVGERAREALRHTLTHGEAEALREALQDERELRDELRRRAARILEGVGRAASQAVLDRVTVNLDALALSPAAAAEAGRGWLSGDLEPPGFEILAGLQIAAGGRDRRGLRLVPPPAPAKRKEPEKKAAPAKKARAESQDREDTRRRKETRKEEAARAREEAAERARREREEERNRERIARAEEKVAAAEAEAEALRREAERAERAAAEAAKAVEEAQRRARDAREAAERARARAERAGRDLARAEETLERVRQISG